MLDVTIKVVAEVPQLSALTDTLIRFHSTVIQIGEQLMANFTALTAQLTILAANHQALGTALQQEIAELAAVIAQLSTDAVDQAAVDAAVAQLRTVNSGLQTIKTGIEDMVTTPAGPTEV